MAQYPNTRLNDYAQDPDYGGQPAIDFGGPAWNWVNSVIQAVERYLLQLVLAPRGFVVAVSQSGAIAGDVAVFDAAAAVSGGGYPIQKYSAPSPYALFVGVYAEPVSASGTAKIITHGVVPPNVSGLAPAGAPQPVGISAATGRLRVAQTGDVVVGILDLQGNVYLNGSGQQAV